MCRFEHHPTHFYKLRSPMQRSSIRAAQPTKRTFPISLLRIDSSANTENSVICALTGRIIAQLATRT
jgi:hypothetical protein